ncbi:hypothetical protein [uncultured Ornithinimicrobium sp.]|uniref:hypothetical protein n=1 Tax=uncultured Ornithinimicrobium sp. TaxID=259307 RepID=UPI00259340CD|nr:hypothetical protein [uncultured Ornithinimicrobium sp.]
MGRFSQAADDARSTTPRGVSRQEGWWIVTLAVVLGVSHAFLYQSHAFEWGGVLRAAVLFLTIFGVAWVSLQRRAAERVHPAGHGRLLAAALAWGVLVVLVAGWFWIVPADGHPVGWGLTSLVAAIGVLPLVLVGLRLVRAGDRRV